MTDHDRQSFRSPIRLRASPDPAPRVNRSSQGCAAPDSVTMAGWRGNRCRVVTWVARGSSPRPSYGMAAEVRRTRACCCVSSPRSTGRELRNYWASTTEAPRPSPSSVARCRGGSRYPPGLPLTTRYGLWRLLFVPFTTSRLIRSSLVTPKSPVTTTLPLTTRSMTALLAQPCQLRSSTGT